MCSNYLEIELLDEISTESCLGNDLEKKILPFANSQLFFKPIKNVEKLTKGEDVKTVYKLSIDLTGLTHDFSPGNTIAIIPCNNEIIVEKILARLNLESVADKQCHLKISKETTKKNPVIPKHLFPPLRNLRNIFLHRIDIQTPPKKLFLKSLLKFTHDSQEIAKLEEICLPKNSKEYIDLITGSGRTFLGLLNTFPSCHPSVETILEHLPPLQPRAFSISSSPLEKSQLDVTFSVVRHNDGTKGLCTGWLEKLIDKYKGGEKDLMIPFYFRQSNNFQLITNYLSPIVMIATGTGIAPFRGFLQHRSIEIKDYNKKWGDAWWLFFGCRYSDRDCLYKSEMEEYLKCRALTRLNLCCSRENEQKHYVQHDIEKYGKDLVDLIINRSAVLYICGDSKTMMKDVKSAIINNLINFNCMNESDAQNYLNELQRENRYITDCWI